MVWVNGQHTRWGESGGVGLGSGGSPSRVEVDSRLHRSPGDENHQLDEYHQLGSAIIPHSVAVRGIM